MVLLKSKAAIKEGRPHMKLNLKSTIAAPAGQTLNGIVGNTRRGIQVDQTLDPDSNNPVANKPVSTALAALVGKIDAALQKPTGLTKTKLVGVGTQGQENIEIGDNLTLTNGKLVAAGGSVSPTLNLIDLNNGEVRTSITEEEYNNLKNGLYSQVIYATDDNAPSIYSPSKLFDEGGEYGFVQFKIVANADRTLSYSSMNTYSITIGEKNTSNEYPITIDVIDDLTINPPSASGGSSIDKLDIEFKFNGTTTLTQEQLSLINSYDRKYVYIQFNEGLIGDNVYLGYVINRQDFGTVISIVSQPNISGNSIAQSAIAITGTTAAHEEITVPFSTTNSEKFLKTNSEGKPEWASISTPTITFED